MKKVLLLLALAASISSSAQIRDDKNCFNHLSVGLNLSSAGWGLEVGTPICPIVTARVGIESIPSIGINTWTHFNLPSTWDKLPTSYQNKFLPDGNTSVDLKTKLKMTNGKLLFDIYTGKNSMFHFTVGAYFGGRSIASVEAEGSAVKGICDYNDQAAAGDLEQYNISKSDVATIDGYRFGSQGQKARFDIRTNAVRPYIGIGVGRTVPRKRIGCKVEAGVLIWGKPKVHDYYADHDVSKYEVTPNSDFYDLINTVQKFRVYPVLKFSVFGRIF